MRWTQRSPALGARHWRTDPSCPTMAGPSGSSRPCSGSGPSSPTPDGQLPYPTSSTVGGDPIRAPRRSPPALSTSPWEIPPRSNMAMPNDGLSPSPPGLTASPRPGPDPGLWQVIDHEPVIAADNGLHQLGAVASEAAGEEGPAATPLRVAAHARKCDIGWPD